MPLAPENSRTTARDRKTAAARVPVDPVATPRRVRPMDEIHRSE